METPQFQPNFHQLNFKNWNSSFIPNILQEIFLQQIYKPFLSGKKDLTIFDVGMNISLFSIYAAPYAKVIYGFEPAQETYDLAVLNLTENGFTNVKSIKKAIASENGKTTFYHSTNSTMNSLNPAVNNTGESEEVELIRLDTFVEQEKIEHIDFMKLDCEGQESRILSSESFRNIAPILDAFVYEHHSWTESSPSVINHGLQELGFIVKQIPSDATIFSCVKL